VRVNISYSIELEDVPKEVDRILEECEGKLRDIHGILNQAIGQSPLQVIADLDKLRIKLAKLDLELGDSMHIMSGYVRAMASKPEMEHGQQPPANPHEEVANDDEEL
jgi:hypothetical protein